MASLTAHADPTSRSGGWVIGSDNPAVLAAVPDALVQLLGLSNDTVTCWALHPSEQDGVAHAAYSHERQELGHLATVEIVELARPRQHKVVWIDRHHLIARSPSAAVIGRLLGLYAGSEGSLLAYTHHPSVSGSFTPLVAQMPHGGGHEWDEPAIIEQARFGVRYAGDTPQQLRLACATPYRQQATQALAQLAQHVQAW